MYSINDILFSCIYLARVIPSGYSMVSCETQTQRSQIIKNSNVQQIRKENQSNSNEKKLPNLVLNYKTKWCIFYCNITENHMNLESKTIKQNIDSCLKSNGPPYDHFQEQSH